MLINGSNLKNIEKQESPACLTIGQAIVLNAKKRSKGDPEAKPRHWLEREPPLLVYIGLNIHGLSRKPFLALLGDIPVNRACLGQPIVPIVFFQKKRNDYPLNYTRRKTLNVWRNPLFARESKGNPPTRLKNSIVYYS